MINIPSKTPQREEKLLQLGSREPTLSSMHRLVLQQPCGSSGDQDVALPAWTAHLPACTSSRLHNHFFGVVFFGLSLKLCYLIRRSSNSTPMKLPNSPISRRSPAENHSSMAGPKATTVPKSRSRRGERRCLLSSSEVAHHLFDSSTQVASHSLLLVRQHSVVRSILSNETTAPAACRSKALSLLFVV